MVVVAGPLPAGYAWQRFGWPGRRPPPPPTHTHTHHHHHHKHTTPSSPQVQDLVRWLGEPPDGDPSAAFELLHRFSGDFDVAFRKAHRLAPAT